MTEDTLEDALEFAQRAHGGQVRKYTGEPYWMHPLAVSRMLAEYTSDTDVLIAAILHDVLEDTTAIYADIEAAFSKRVADLVQEVTDVSKPSDGNRKIRKEMDRLHLAKSSPEGATIKLADMYDNMVSIAEHDKNFARIYLKEKDAYLEVLRHGDSKLWNRVKGLCDDVKKKLEGEDAERDSH